VIDETLLEAMEKMDKAVEHTQQQFSTVRTGRATPSLVERINVEYYGAHVPLQQIASISVPEARQLLIKPHDRNSLEAVEKARPVILEPVVKIRITAQDSAMGDLAGDLSGRRGRINGSESKSGGRIAIDGEVPLAELSGYESRLKSLTGGEGTYQIELSHYAAVPGNIQKQLGDAYQRAADD